MPIYEYSCEKCGIVEAIQKFDDAPLEVCPECGQTGIQKEISASAFHLKGTGWYKTDYASGGSTQGGKKSSAKSKDSSAESSASDSKDSSAKSEAKPAAKCSTGCGCH